MGAEGSDPSLGQETLLCGSAEGVVGGDAQSSHLEYPLQGYIEAFLSAFVPEKGLEEVEIMRMECLMSELIRLNLLSHDAWLHSLIAKGVFLTTPTGRQVCM
jgi:hypothetical protein